jgi:hypothetical protein
MPSKKDGAPVSEETPDVERESSAPTQQTSGDGNSEVEFIHLPAIISDEFGISRSQARMEVATGTVSVDGEERLVGQDMDIPREEVAGKTIEVKGGNARTFRFQIDATP